MIIFLHVFKHLKNGRVKYRYFYQKPREWFEVLNLTADKLSGMEQVEPRNTKNSEKVGDTDTQTSKPSYLPGEVINGRYEVIKLLGRGSVGVVYQVRDHKVGTKVAVKLISEAVRRETTAAARLHQEIRIAYSIKSDYVTNLYSLFTDDHHIGLVLEYVDGQSLFSYLQAKTVFGVRDIMNIGRQVALGLQAIHEAGIIHRDLKLENILLDDTGMTKITDFGVSILQSALIEEDIPLEAPDYELKRRATEVGKVVGTLHYLSPEYLTKRTFDPRTDIYALGIVLYELTTCTFPYRFTSPRQLVEKKIKEDPLPPSKLREDCPQWLDDLILKAMARDPEKRFQTAEELYEEISPRLRTLPTGQRSQNALQVKLRRSSTHINSSSSGEFVTMSTDRIEDFFGSLFDKMRFFTSSSSPEATFRTIVITSLVLTLISVSLVQRYKHDIQNTLAVSDTAQTIIRWFSEPRRVQGSGKPEFNNYKSIGVRIKAKESPDTSPEGSQPPAPPSESEK